MEERTVFVVDDHPVVLDGIEGILERWEGLDLIGRSTEPGAAVEEIASRQPDVALIDLDLGGVDSGIATLDAIARRAPAVNRAVYSAFTSFRAARLVYEGSHASVLISKAERPETVCRWIEIAAEGARGLSPFVQREALLGDDEEPFSDRQLAILWFMAKTDRTYAQIADELGWSEVTVKREVEELKTRLEVSSRGELLHAAGALGLVAESCPGSPTREISP